MENYEHLYRIALLLSRMSAGMITAQENQELLDWVSQSGQNQELYDKWREGEGLQEDFRKYAAFDVAAAQKELERRIEEKSGSRIEEKSGSRIEEKSGSRIKRRRNLIIRAALIPAAVITILTVLHIVAKRHHDPHPEQQISLIAPDDPILYFDGRTISLDNAAVTTGGGELKVVAADGTEHILSPHADSPHTPTISIVVPKGRIYALTLEDGTSVTLNAASKLHYPLNFDKDSREVRLTGEAFFRAAADASRPFRVITDNQTAEVVGTEFNVNAYPEYALTATTVFTGKVRIAHAGNQEVATPGTQVVSGVDVWLLRSVNTDNVAAWKTGSFSLEGKTLETVMTELSRWYDFEVVYQSERLKQIMFRGVVPRYDSFDRILGIMQKTEEIGFEVNGATVTVVNYQ